MGKAVCPHCGEKFNRLKDGKVPTHDWPRPCRAVCPGTGQEPRTEDDERPLWKDSPEQRAEDFWNDARQELLLYGFAVVKEVAAIASKTSGTVICPLCQGTVAYLVASNGHCRARCQTDKCINAME